MSFGSLNLVFSEKMSGSDRSWLNQLIQQEMVNKDRFYLPPGKYQVEMPVMGGKYHSKKTVVIKQGLLEYELGNKKNQRDKREQVGYTVVEESEKLGEGGQGAVYVGRYRVRPARGGAQVKKLKHERAIKKEVITKSDTASLKLFKDGVERSVNNSRLVEGTSSKKPVFTDDQTAFSIMRRHPGNNLRHFLEDDEFQAKCTFMDRLHILILLAKALQEVHAQEIVHYDLKPENIILNIKENGEISLRITDYGISKQKGRTLNNMKNKVQDAGTLGYAAPEILLEKGVNSRAIDIFSLGMIFVELMTKDPNAFFEVQKQIYFQGQTFSALSNQDFLEKYVPVDVPNIKIPTTQGEYAAPELFRHCLRQMLNKDQKGRYEIDKVVAIMEAIEVAVLRDDLQKMQDVLTTVMNTINEYGQHSKYEDKKRLAQGIVAKAAAIQNEIADLLRQQRITHQDYDALYNRVDALLAAETTVQIYQGGRRQGTTKSVAVNGLFSNKNPLMKFINGLTRPLSILVGIIKKNEVMRHHGFFPANGAVVMHKVTEDVRKSSEHRLSLTGLGRNVQR